MVAGSEKKVTAKTEDKKDAEEKAAAAAATPTEEVKKDPTLLTVEDVREHCRLLERSVISKESRFAFRVLRGLPATRKKLNGQVIRKIISGFYTHSNSARDFLLNCLPDEDVMETDEPGSTSGSVRLRGAKSALTPLLPEVDCYLHLLVLLHLLDAGEAHKDAAVKCSESLVGKLAAQNRRSLDQIAARCYYYHTLAHEAVGKLDKIRDFLHGRLRTATLSNDFESQAILINCLLRNYLHYNLYEQAEKLVLKASFPEKNASNSESARYLYYIGRIKAIQLEYSEASKHLTQALRKSPSSAIGFRQTVHKLSVTVQLLLGTIPERHLFLEKVNKASLAPYFELTKAIRSGDVDLFQAVLEKYSGQFQADRTFTLILRLHHNVIKTAIRRISLAYSCISLADVAKKLRLDSPMDAEYIIAKAIRDGVIEAVLDHEHGRMQSKENTDIYCTREPQLAFHQRIQFCLDLHNHSVKAMRFPPKSYHQDLESAEDRREREAQDMEYAKELADSDDDDLI